MSAAAAPAPPRISVCSAPTCQPIAACTIGADVGSWKEVERAFKEADSVNKRMKAGSRMQRHAQRDLKSSAVPRIPLRHGHPPHDVRMDFQKEL